MKKTIKIAALSLLLGLGTITLVSSSPKCQYGQCSKIKADGYRCKNCSQSGSIYCWSHNR